MSKGHRPFWVLRHRITGETKRVGFASVEDSAAWQVILTDGSIEAALDHPEAAGVRIIKATQPKPAAMRKAARRKKQRKS